MAALYNDFIQPHQPKTMKPANYLADDNCKLAYKKRFIISSCSAFMDLKGLKTGGLKCYIK